MASVTPYDSGRGKRWRVRYRDASGKEHSRSFIKKGDADTFAVDIMRRKQLGPLYQAAPQEFGEYADQWLAKWESMRRPSPSTLDSVRRNLVLHLKPLRGQRIDHITAATVEDVIAKLAADHPRTAQHALETCKRVFRDARGRGQMVDERIFELERPKYEYHEAVFLTWPQVQALAQQSSISHLIQFAALSGLRLGELCALKDEDIQDGAVKVSRSGYRDRERTKTKTKASVRTVPLSSVAMRIVREAQLVRPRGSVFIFPAPDGGQWTKRGASRRWETARKRYARLAEASDRRQPHAHGVSPAAGQRTRGEGSGVEPEAVGTSPSSSSKRYAKMLSGEGVGRREGIVTPPPVTGTGSRLTNGASAPSPESILRMHFHDLRHTYASLLVAAGVMPKQGGELMGHNDGGALFMRRYAHLYPSALTDAASKLDALLKRDEDGTSQAVEG